MTEVFEEQMKVAGFEDRVVRDVSERMARSVNRLLFYCYPGLVYTHLWQLLGWRNRIQTLNTYSTYYQHRAFKRGLWKYNIISATKPDRAPR